MKPVTIKQLIKLLPPLVLLQGCLMASEGDIATNEFRDPYEPEDPVVYQVEETEWPEFDGGTDDADTD